MLEESKISKFTLNTMENEAASSYRTIPTKKKSPKKKPDFSVVDKEAGPREFKLARNSDLRLPDPTGKRMTNPIQEIQRILNPKK